MLFNSREFALFFSLFFTLYALVRNAQFRRYLIVFGSLAFYAYFKPIYLVILVTCVLVNFFTIHILDRLPQKSRKAWMVITLNCIFNLGILFVYKYTDFLFRTLNWGFHTDLPILKLALPLGVSFFTFEMMAYSIDVYRHGHIDPEARSLPRYALFVTFFPKLIAGPIVRGWELLPQIDTPRTVTVEKVYWGLILFIWGLVKKVLISDRLSPFVASVYDAPFDANHHIAASNLHWAGNWLAIYAFAFQIYCDFSAYSDMAMGICRMLGYELPLNFKEPYLSPNITIFWRRWHITLSAWLRDYLYIPLGGNRGGTVKQYRNLILTMLLGGLWHGANWVYVIWGLMHGLYLAVHKFVSNIIEHREIQELASAADRGETPPEHGASATAPKPKKKKPPEPPTDPWSKASYWFWCIVTFHFVCLTWIFFRAGLAPIDANHPTAWQNSVAVLKSIFLFRGKSAGAAFWAQGYAVVPYLILAIILHVVERLVRHHRPAQSLAIWDRLGAIGQGVLVAGCIGLLIVLGGEQAQFIYFAF